MDSVEHGNRAQPQWQDRRLRSGSDAADPGHLQLLRTVGANLVQMPARWNTTRNLRYIAITQVITLTSTSQDCWWDGLSVRRIRYASSEGFVGVLGLSAG